MEIVHLVACLAPLSESAFSTLGVFFAVTTIFERVIGLLNHCLNIDMNPYHY